MITAKTKNGNIFQSIRYEWVPLHLSIEVCKAGMDIFVAYIFMTVFKVSFLKTYSSFGAYSEPWNFQV